MGAEVLMPLMGESIAEGTITKCFFFSSRRRHTRCLSDWSSDVCSSDLTAAPPFKNVIMNGGAAVGKSPIMPASPRSEERRVGKECTPRSSPPHPQIPPPAPPDIHATAPRTPHHHHHTPTPTTTTTTHHP